MEFARCVSGMKPVQLAMCTRCIAGPIAPFGRKALRGRTRKLRYRKSWIGICGWVQRQQKTILKNWYHLTGAAGGTMEPVHLAIWRVTLLNLLFGYWVLAIQTA